MKFTRQFLVVLGVVAVIMALGFAMQHSPAASLVTDRRVDQGRALPDGTSAAHFADNGGGRDGGFDITRADDLVQSLVILGLIVAGVVLVDRVRRQRAPVVSGSRSRP
ncbi:MAG: hypothetical protein ABJC79_07505 [Acidimicrobiia bacterium]